MQLLGREVHLFAAEVFDAEADATQLDGVELLHLVVKFAVGILEGAHHEPEAIDALLVEVVFAVVNVETVCMISFR